LNRQTFNDGSLDELVEYVDEDIDQDQDSQHNALIDTLVYNTK
jgi:hypothetical protein